jgi:hypothetical protein
MAKNDHSAAKADDFLAGGGEMGERMRALDWTATPLGPVTAWPQSLKTIVRVMLDSRYAKERRRSIRLSAVTTVLVMRAIVASGGRHMRSEHEQDYL